MAKEKKIEKEEVEMTVAEARALRAKAHVPAPVELSQEEAKEEFRKFWAQEKAKYGKLKSLEEIVWLHLKAIKHAVPEKFESGIAHFGLKKVK